MIIGFVSCFKSKKPDIIMQAIPIVKSEEKNHLEAKDSILIDSLLLAGNIDGLRLEISSDKHGNLLIAIFNEGDYLWGAEGAGNSSLVNEKPNPLIRECEIISNKKKEYVLESYVNGSTYGAGNIFIIWNDGIDWQIDKTPFQRAFLEDRDGDGVLEIVEYFNSKTEDGDVYEFANGCFMKK